MIRSIGSILIYVLLVTASPARCEEAPQPPTEMGQFVVGLLYRGPASTRADTEEAKTVQAGHMANINRLIASGAMALAGPFDDAGDLRGMFIFNVKTVAEARKLVESDPAVRSRRLRIELFSWYGPAALATIVKAHPKK